MASILFYFAGMWAHGEKSNDMIDLVLQSQPVGAVPGFKFLNGPSTFSGSHDDGMWNALLYIKVDEWLTALGRPDPDFFVSPYYSS